MFALDFTLPDDNTLQVCAPTTVMKRSVELINNQRKIAAACHRCPSPVSPLHPFLPSSFSPPLLSRNSIIIILEPPPLSPAHTHTSSCFALFFCGVASFEFLPPSKVSHPPLPPLKKIRPLYIFLCSWLLLLPPPPSVRAPFPCPPGAVARHHSPFFYNWFFVILVLSVSDHLRQCPSNSPRC